ncbi:MAG: CHAP domain-containing protein, partial [Chloroflexota bacterium]|nr:CHAP domain-containing protein [Chloroflexota bacterium]
GATAAAAPSSTGAAVLDAARTQVGQGEQPPGSNDGPAVAAYRSAVAGSLPGDPWCAEFVSWAAAQAGAPLGDGGSGFRSVAALTDWASRSGRLLPAGSVPRPGDLILFGDRHVGIVEAVEPNGTIDTIEGNYANAVTRVHRSPSEATGFVQM